ncbi:hypothetical protein JCM21900_001246 [Sporobolomyces salmonicolor]
MSTSTSTNAPAPPNPQLVIRKLNQSTTIFSVPFKRGNTVPFGGRSTAIKLQSGDVWVAASHPLCPATLETITSMGPVKHLVMLDAEHGMYLKSYFDAFPEARLYMPAGGVKKWKSKGILPENSTKYFSYGEGSPDPLEGETGGEIKSADFGRAFINEDIAFYHAPTKTLIEADLLFNLPPTEQYSKTDERPTIPFLSNLMRPGTSGHKRFLWYLASKDRKEMGVQAKIVADWDFDRVIPCHGDVIETGGKKAWLDTYADFLEQQ